MNYIKIDFNSIKGFQKLTEQQKKLFIKTYKENNNCFGLEEKEKWKPIKVQALNDDLIVHFKNGEWLHYTSRGDWY
jgi:hypothetical protein